MVRDQVSHEMCDIDATGSPWIENRAPGWRRMKLVGAHVVFVEQTVWTNGRPLDLGVILTNLRSQVVRGFLVIPMRRHQPTDSD